MTWDVDASWNLKYRYWHIYEDSLKIGVWCAISDERIIDPIFFRNPVDSRIYVNDILSPFYWELTDRERDFTFFQQDSATAHTADISMREIERVFHDRIINRDLWPTCSSNMTPCDSISGVYSKMLCTWQTHAFCKNWNVISVTKLTSSVDENYGEL